MIKSSPIPWRSAPTDAFYCPWSFHSATELALKVTGFSTTGEALSDIMLNTWAVGAPSSTVGTVDFHLARQETFTILNAMGGGLSRMCS